MRQLCKQSGHSRSKIFRIINYWLSQEPPELTFSKVRCIKYLLFDGTYFHKDGCLLIVLNSKNGHVIGVAYEDKENYKTARTLFEKLKAHRVRPKAIVVDGHLAVLAALRATWPDVLIQRCLFHILRQGLQWLRTKPKTEAGKELRLLIKSLGDLKTEQDMVAFISNYHQWRSRYRAFVKQLPWNGAACKDLKKAMGLIENALPDMFHFIKDRNIRQTTNILEGFFAELKRKYRSHRGLSLKHKITYLKWYCYYHNRKNSNFF